MKNITYINAGAGSGKTYTLTEKLCELITLNKCSISEIIMTTFTEKAAADLRKETKEKLLSKEKILEAAQIDYATIGTVHSIAFKYIKRYWYKLGISASVTAIDDVQKANIAKTLLSNVMTEEDIIAFKQYAITFGLKQSKSSKYDYDFWRKLLEKLIDKATAFDVTDITNSEQKSLAFAKQLFEPDGRIGFVNPNKTEAELRSIYYSCIERIFSIYNRCYRQYEIYKKRHNVVEFNDMESMFLSLLKDEEVKQDIHSSIKYVFVDEFQDSNPKQIRIFDLLSELVEHSFWVGDPKQAIYGFRACDTTLVQAVMTHIQSQSKLENDSFEYKNLDTSYRSVDQLVKNTNKVFTSVFCDMTDVELETHRKEELPISSLIHWDARKPNGVNAKGQPKFVCDAKDAYNAIAFKINKMLQGKETPCKVYDKNSKSLRDIKPSDIAILVLINEDVAMVAEALHQYRIPVKTKSKITNDSVEIRIVILLLNYLLHADSELLKAEIAHLYCDLSTADFLKGVTADISTVVNVCNNLANLPVSAIVRQLILRLDLMHTCGKWGNVVERQQNLVALMAHAEQYDNSCVQTGETASIDSYLAKLEEGFEKGDLFIKDGVNVMTYHKSKGLQWPIVILCSLDKSKLSQKDLVKHFTNEVTAMRMTDPTPDNLYSEYYLLCMPPYISGSTKPTDSIVAAIEHDASFVKYQQLQKEEKQHLMYVGATRARDYMITVSKKGGELKLLKEIGVESSLTKTLTNPQTVWGKGTNGIDVEIIMPEDNVMIQPETSYDDLFKNNMELSNMPKYLQPSKCDDPELVKNVRVELRFPDDSSQASRILVGKTTDYDTFGTCIHNFMAVYNPNQSQEHNVQIATRVINAFCLKDILPHPEQVVSAAEQLYNWLNRTYGNAYKIEHEMPFYIEKNGQIIAGEIDLLWYLSENECVLLDFKNYPGAISHVQNNNDEKYAGRYAPQMQLYKHVLENNHINVKSVLIYYAVLGCIIEIIELK